jgi:hypothetical protein
VGVVGESFDHNGCYITGDQHDGFDKQVMRFRFASSDVIDVMRTFQPFSAAPLGPEHSVLYQVSNLDNADKHRVLSRAPITPVSVSIGWSASRRAEWVNGRLRPFAPGLEIGRYLFAEPTSSEDTPLEFRFGFTLGTDPWMPHDIRYRFADYAKTIRNGVIMPICLRVDL